MKKAEASTNRHYVNNKEFLLNISAHRDLVIEWKSVEENELPKPRVPDYIGECFVKIANHLAYKANFVNYTFRDEMILDGIENCITYMDNFDPAKSSNPFAYFTQITYYAFIRRIQKEKKYQSTKMRYIQNLEFSEILAQDHGNDVHATEFLDYMRKKIDESNKHEAEFANEKSKIPKRRPKYLDDKEALALAKEKIEALKEI